VSRIRVLLVIPTLDQSGAEKQFTLLATGLPQDQFEVHVVALTRGGPFVEELARHGISVTILNKRWKFDPFCLRKLARLIRVLKPDVIHSWLFAANSYCRMVAGGRGQPAVIVSERCVDSWKSGWQLALDRWQIPRTARLIGNSNSVANFYRQQQFPDDRIQVIPNGIELPPVRPDPSDPKLGAEVCDRRAERFGLPKDAKIVGFVGRLARQKQVMDLLWSLVLLKDADPRISLVLVGDGPERDGLERFVHESNLEEHVRFLGHRSDVDQILPLFDVFAMTSGFEGMSNSIMEAMATGLPVVASDIAANQELVYDGVTGFLFPVGDRTACARALLFLFEHPDRAKQMGIAGRERMATEFSVEKMVAEYAETYRSFVK
jgi:glycosyltransferase involved in cell wall biosynthesis